MPAIYDAHLGDGRHIEADVEEGQIRLTFTIGADHIVFCFTPGQASHLASGLIETAVAADAELPFTLWDEPMSSSSTPTGGQPPIRDLDTGQPHSARVWNYLLGGKDNYPADREAAEALRKTFPDIVNLARADRAFLQRVLRYLVTKVGITQFLDIGTGLPTENNTHEVAQRLNPAARIVYVDNDPLVLTHARALLISTPEGATDYVDADLRDPQTILEAAAATLDLTQPVGLMLLGIMHFIQDDAEAHTILGHLTHALAPGSHMAIAHYCDALTPTTAAETVRLWNQSGTPKIRTRSIEEIRALFDGWELADPGVVSCSLWRPDPTDVGTPRPVAQFCGVAKKPRR